MCVCNSCCSHLSPSTALHFRTTRLSDTHIAQTTLPLSAQSPARVSPWPVPLGTSTVRILVLATWQLHLPSICLSLLLSLTSLRCFLRDERSSTWAVLSQPKTASIWLEVRCNLVHRKQRIYFYLKASCHAPIIFIVLQNILYIAIGSWDICKGIECYMIQYSLLLVMSLPVCGRQEWRGQCVSVWVKCGVHRIQSAGDIIWDSSTSRSYCVCVCMCMCVCVRVRDTCEGLCIYCLEKTKNVSCRIVFCS